MEVLFLNSFHICIIHKNKLFCITFLLLFSLMSVYMPHSLVESSEHHNDESSFKYIINNNKPVTNLKKLLNKLKSFVIILFRLPKILLNRVVLATILLALFNMRFMRFSKVSILHLFHFLCFYFYGTKYKHNMNHSDLLLLMGV